ncbi:MAG: hypothetical protein AB7U29_18660, partial [Desulfobulbus sp.]
MKHRVRKIILFFGATDFVRRAIAERADLSAFREKPTPLVLAGVGTIALSFLLGWPAVAALGVLSLKLQTPWIGVIGGPLVYGVSHLVCVWGLSLSGAVCAVICCRWLSR